MVPVQASLERMAEDLGKMEPDYDKLCKDPEVISVREATSIKMYATVCRKLK